MTWELADGEAWALSLYQPWAHLVVRSIKDVENRSWSTTFRGTVYIHAGKTGGHGELEQNYVTVRAWLRTLSPSTPLPPMEKVERGGIIGMVDIVDIIRPCLRQGDDPSKLICRCGRRWHIGSQYGFVLRNAKPLPFQPLPGIQRFFKFSPNDATLAVAYPDKSDGRRYTRNAGRAK